MDNPCAHQRLARLNYVDFAIILFRGVPKCSVFETTKYVRRHYAGALNEAHLRAHPDAALEFPSGSQIQTRLKRHLARNPRILILDEATCAGL